MRLPPPGRFPKTVIINDETWKIQFVKVIERNRKLLGLTIWPDRIIKLKITQSRPELISTFIHELLHAIAHEYDFRVPHKTVYRLETAITELLLVNF